MVQRIRPRPCHSLQNCQQDGVWSMRWEFYRMITLGISGGGWWWTGCPSHQVPLKTQLATVLHESCGTEQPTAQKQIWKHVCLSARYRRSTYRATASACGARHTATAYLTSQHPSRQRGKLEACTLQIRIILFDSFYHPFLV